jgi:hypothetical protein
MSHANPICQSYLEGLIPVVKQYSPQNEQRFRIYINTMFSDSRVKDEFMSFLWQTYILRIVASNVNALKIILEYVEFDIVIWMHVFYITKKISETEYYDSLEVIYRHPSYLEYFQGSFPYENYICLEKMNPQITQIIDKIRMEYNLPPYTLVDEEDDDKICVNLLCTEPCCRKRNMCVFD